MWNRWVFHRGLIQLGENQASNHAALFSFKCISDEDRCFSVLDDDCGCESVLDGDGSRQNELGVRDLDGEKCERTANCIRVNGVEDSLHFLQEGRNERLGVGWRGSIR